jgi:hypothetical protein
MAPFSATMAAKVQSLFPQRNPLEGLGGIEPACPSLVFSKGDVVGALRSFKVGTAYGQDDLFIRHLLDTLGPPANGLGSLVLEGLTSLHNAVFRGAMPAGIQPFWVGGPVTPLVKPQGGISLIAVGSILGRLAFKIAVRAALPSVGPYLRPLQVGVGVRGGQSLFLLSFNWMLQARQHDGSLSLLQPDF